MKLIDNQDRNILQEGRNFQMGFAFCKYENKTLTTVQPISPCKDYLNDVVFSEHTNMPCSAYGLHYKKNNIFDKRNYMVFKICESFNDGKYNGYEEHIKNLNSNIKNLIDFVQFFDKKFKVRYKSIIRKTDIENTYYVSFDYDWCKSTYGISLYSFLLRIGQFYDGSEIMSFIENYNSFNEDVYLMNDIRPILTDLLEEGKLPEQDLFKYKGNTILHDTGILKYKN